jgi:hypothetical protein
MRYDVKRTLFDDDHDEFRKSVQTFVARTIVPDHEQMIAGRSIDRSVWLEAGLPGARRARGVRRERCR